MFNNCHLFTAKHLRFIFSAIFVLIVGLTVCLSNPALSQTQSQPAKPVIVEDIIPRLDPSTKIDNTEAVLPFGADLFAGTPPTTSVNPDQPVPAGYIYGSGDKLRIR
ncbi:MAG: hypothetical protein ACYC0V_11950, partial [Armatimonadota bacterium]